MNEALVPQSQELIDRLTFSSSELTNICIKIVVNDEDQLFNNISKMDINQDFAQKYLEYLMKLMRLNKPIDFIQAALVMQTLSSVFAKKVDNLQEQILAFTIVFRKLELGSRDNGNGNENENGDAEGTADGQERTKMIRKRNLDKETILHAFENVCTANNIRKSCIKEWSDKDFRSTTNPFCIRNKLNECPKLKTKEVFSPYIYDSKLDKLGKREEFGCNGILCNDLTPKDNFCLFCPHTSGISRLNDSVNGSTLFNEPILPTAAAEENTNVLNADNEDDWQNAATDVSPISNQHEHSYHQIIEEYLNHSIDAQENSISGHVYFERINKVHEVLVDVGGIYNILWSPVADDNKQIERKIKKRNVKVNPEEFRKENETKSQRLEYPTEYVLSDLMLAVFKLKSNVPLHPHFSKSLLSEREFRGKRMNKKGYKRIRNALTNPRNADFRGFNEFGDDDVDNNDFEHEQDVALPETHNDDTANAVDIDADNHIQEAIQHIREYQQGLYQNHQEDTINELALKVSAWHDNIKPHLEKEEARTNFDIHEYGSRILQRFPSNNAKNTITFSDCVQSQPREEIPRYFLSSLLLANSYNVEIGKSGTEELSMNDMTLTLLSRVRQHEILNERMRKELS